jgi:hypothetical protein
MRIQVNGQTLTVPDGANISISGDTVTVNGDLIGASLTAGIQRLVIEGNCGSITTQRASVEVTGDVTGDINAGSSVRCGNVNRSVSAGGSVTVAGTVSGDVSAGGSITCGPIGGSASAGGSIRHS